MVSETLLLSEDEAKSLLTMEETMKAVENALREKGLGHTQLPPKIYLYFTQYEGDLRTMPSYLERLNQAGVKIVTVHPSNPRRYQKPAVLATIILIDPQNGLPIAIMSGTAITAMRTGAISGIATKYLAKPNSSTLGLVGLGVQARMQLLAINKVLKLRVVRVYDQRIQAVDVFIKEGRRSYPFVFTPCETVEECVEGADVISTTTPSRSPIVNDEWILPGTHINAIGADAPGKEELDPMILKRAKIVVDDVSQAIHSGEVNVPLAKGTIRIEDIYAELGDVILGKKEGRLSEKEITVFDSTGLSLQDVASAYVVFEKAKRSNIGKWVTII